MRVNYELFVEFSEKIAPIVSRNGNSDEKSDLQQKSFRSLEYQFRISRKAISYIIDEICKAIATLLAGTYLKFSSCQDVWRNIEKKFLEKWSFRHGKHIEIIGCGIGSQYYNCKSTNSIVLLAGSNYEVTCAKVGMNCRISDGVVLKIGLFVYLFIYLFIYLIHYLQSISL